MQEVRNTDSLPFFFSLLVYTPFWYRKALSLHAPFSEENLGMIYGKKVVQV